MSFRITSFGNSASFLNALGEARKLLLGLILLPQTLLCPGLCPDKMLYLGYTLAVLTLHRTLNPCEKRGKESHRLYPEWGGLQVLHTKEDCHEGAAAGGHLFALGIQAQSPWPLHTLFYMKKCLARLFV